MKFDVKKFAELARIKITPKEEKQFGKDLAKILKHFEELQELNTEKVPPVTGGTSMKNIFREDSVREKKRKSDISGCFPETKDGYLKVPNVFE